MPVTDAQAWGIALACIMMCADVLSGYLVAVIRHEVSSTKMREGLLHKVLILILIFACLAIEIGTTHMIELPYDVPTCEVVCGFVIVMEVTSVLENISRGYPGFSDSALFKLFKSKEDSDDGSDV